MIEAIIFIKFLMIDTQNRYFANIFPVCGTHLNIGNVLTKELSLIFMKFG